MTWKSDAKLGVLGAGRFGRAFIEGVLKSGTFPASQVWACDRSEEILKNIKALGATPLTDLTKVLPQTDILLLSVKPAQIAEVIGQLNQSGLSDKTLLISVAAGTSLSKLENLLKVKCPVVRVMPNSPCAVQEGFAAICKGTYATADHISVVSKIFKALGGCAEIEEKHFDLVTALSGSGPAYFYFFMDVMIEDAVRNGLSRETATELVSQTARGAAVMVQKTKRTPADLKKDVATPGGCTMAALEVLENTKVAVNFSLAIDTATQVAGNLGKN